MMKHIAVGFLLVVAWIGPAVEASADPCADAVADKASGNYKNPESGSGLLGPWHCMSYYNCKYDAGTGKASATKHDCWILLPLRQYDPTERKCVWFWEANCKANNPSPTPAPTSSPTTVTTVSTTVSTTPKP